MEESCTDYFIYLWRSLVQTIAYIYGVVLYKLFHISMQGSCTDYFIYLCMFYGGVFYRYTCVDADIFMQGSCA